MWIGHILAPEGFVSCPMTYSDGFGKEFPEFRDVFGSLGYRTIPMESVYYHAAAHAARM
jgi:hypothetical protein